MSQELLQTDPADSRHANQQKKKVWWINGVFVAFVHVLSLLTPWLYPPQNVPKATWLLTYVSWQLATLGITMGYHRLWSHRAYKASMPLRVVLAWMGTMGFQGSIRWWVLRHRLHHRWTDSEQDPYNAKRGFWFSHMGWIFAKPIYTKFVMSSRIWCFMNGMSLIDAKDLNADPVVRFQHKYYVLLALFNGILLPALVASLWGDFWGGFLYAGYVARVLVWHVTFCINSFAHLVGDQEFSSLNTSKGGFLIALVTNGEGYHNFHHEFPSDYRNGFRWHHWDPTKWLIRGLCLFGLGATDLNVTHDERIEECALRTAQKRIQARLSELSINQVSPPPMQATYSMAGVKDQVKDHGKKWIVLNGMVVDLDRETTESVWSKHPGGQSILAAYLGKDASAAFNGGLNSHTQSAQLWMQHCVIGRLDPSKSEKEE